MLKNINVTVKLQDPIHYKFDIICLSSVFLALPD